MAPLLFTGYLFGFLLGSVITLGDTGWLTAEIAVGIMVAIVVKVGVFHDTSSRALRRTQRSYAARARRLAGVALAAFDEPGPGASRRLYRHKTRLGEATQLIDGQLPDPGVVQGDSAEPGIARRSVPPGQSACPTSRPGLPRLHQALRADGVRGCSPARCCTSRPSTRKMRGRSCTLTAAATGSSATCREPGRPCWRPYTLASASPASP